MTAGGESRPAPRRTLYGRSRGRALRPGQNRLLANALPTVEIAPDALGSPGLFPFEPRQVWLEIGFGSGEHLIDRAKANPDVGLVGCEPFLNGVVAALSAIEREKVANVRLRRGDAQALVEAAPDAFFARVFILYPDPWPKRRHHKRRVVSEAMIEALARVMRSGGELRFATDIDDYAGWTLRRFRASPHFRWTASRAEDWRIPWPDWRPTRYESKAHRAGGDSVYLTFVRL
ncbi:MAG TPA: tRNA (guanosine(46)-N7)-methyltransferase TrmB [Roseiarcus sp.]|jgi:tRNA (guanine-N7-)-methyltransferase|nr:tRNA (guanosine(46)-N7)-methyltransferase TrmB [Roseiarcus sp.]